VPYNVDKEEGGDNKENTSWMEKCTARVESQGKSESQAIAICKSTLKKKKEGKSEAEALVEAYAEEESKLQFFLHQPTNKDKQFKQLLAEYDVYLIKE